MGLSNIKMKVEAFLNERNYDVRVSGNARFMDQKCTPDVLSTVAEAVINYLAEVGETSFTVRNIWESNFSSEVMVSLYQKPDVREQNAQNEYDKFFSQPIKLFEYAGILRVVSASKPFRYEIACEEILNYIAISDRKSLEFLIQYLTKVLKDSGIYTYFEAFFESPSSSLFDKLKISFVNYIIKNTSINKETEPRRIFSKILNPLAFDKKSPGTRGGQFSNTLILYNELFYNRLNFRDLKKPKGTPRNDFLHSISQSSGVSEEYQVDKAKRMVRQYHESVNEVNRYDTNPADHVHHIFPKSLFPELSDTFENLIVINPTQHLSFAHPRGNTRAISTGYQLICLLSKIVSIQESLRKADDFYVLEGFISVVNTGLDSDLLQSGMSFELIQSRLVEFYVVT